MRKIICFCIMFGAQISMAGAASANMPVNQQQVEKELAVLQQMLTTTKDRVILSGNGTRAEKEEKVRYIFREYLLERPFPIDTPNLYELFTKKKKHTV